MGKNPDKTNRSLYYFFQVSSFAALLLLIIFHAHYLHGLFYIFDDHQIIYFKEIFQNINLLLQGYQGGYFRIVSGYFIFFTLSSFFLSFGKILTQAIFKKTSLEKNVGLLERLSIYYLLGSVFASLLWLTIGYLGFVKYQTALILSGIGILAIAVQLFYNNIFNFPLSKLIKEKIFPRVNQLTFTEKSVALLIFSAMALTSTLSVRFQTYSDTYQIHMALPAFYIQEGKLTQHAYCIYSYLTQNLEMLVMWTLLLKSEIAAALLIWGFYSAFVLLIFSFFKRHTSIPVAFCTTLLLISFSSMLRFSTAIKNDLPAAIFLIAQTIYLIETINSYNADPKLSRTWAILSGIFCGGSIDFKYTSVIPAFFSFFTLIGFELYSGYKTKKGLTYSSLFWLLGCISTTLPWLIRTTLETGSPIYPYLNNIFHAPLIKNWHVTPNIPASFTTEGWNGLIKYFQDLVGFYDYKNKVVIPPEWGSGALFGLLLPLFFKKNTISPGVKLALFLNLASLATHLFYSYDIRYHLAYITIIVLLAFALNLNFILQHKGKFTKILKHATFLILIFSTAQTFLLSRIAVMIQDYGLMLLGGIPPGNFNNLYADPTMHDMRWMAHIMNKTIEKNEAVLFAGFNYGYAALDRKLFYSVDPDKQILQEIAEQSMDETELKKNLMDKGIKHILTTPELFNYMGGSGFRKEFRIQDKEIKKIELLFKKYMFIKLMTPDNGFHWHSFNEDKDKYPISLNKEDATEFPIMFRKYAKLALSNGDLETAKKLYEIALASPIASWNKTAVQASLANLYEQKGEYQKAQEFLKNAIATSPKDARTYLYLAIFHLNSAQKNKKDGISQSIQKAIELRNKNYIYRIIKNSPDFLQLEDQF